MALIYQTDNFILESHEHPEIDRQDGGHIKISPKIDVSDRTQLSPSLATELMYLTVLAGKAMQQGLQQQGITIDRINYQENGNWKPHLHIHLYGRSKQAKYQPYGDPLTPGHQPHYHPLTEADITAIQQAINHLLNTDPQFNKTQWHLI